MERGPETYTVEEAARVLERTPGRVRQMLRSGQLSGEHEGGDERKPWRVHKWSAHALRDRLHEDRATTTAPRTPSRSSREPRNSPESADELFRIVQDLQRELGRVEGRLQITETAESSLRADLVRERERAQEERLGLMPNVSVRRSCGGNSMPNALKAFGLGFSEAKV